MSPEYAMEGNFSEKSDVYSFGVLLLELVSGQKNNIIFHHKRPMNLVGYVSFLNLKSFISFFLIKLLIFQANPLVLGWFQLAGLGALERGKKL